MKTSCLVILFTFVCLNGLTQESLEVKSVRFKGNKSFRAAELKAIISLQSSSLIKQKIFKKDPTLYSKEAYLDDIKNLKHFYQKEGYLNIGFDPPQLSITHNKKVKITYRIREGIPIKTSSIQYIVDSTLTLEKTLTPKDRKNILLQKQLKPKRIFRDEYLYHDQALINNQFNDEGYAYAETNFDIKVDTTTYSAFINWRITRGRLCHFGPVVVTGNKRVPTKSIVKQLTFKNGDVWSKEEVDRSQKQIYSLGMFRIASIKTVMSPEKKDTLPIQILIKEAPRWTTRFGAGYGREDQFRAFTDLQYLGFVTNTGRINLYAKHSSLEPYNISLRFTQPAFISPINTLSISPFITKENEPGYTLHKQGWNLSFLQSFSEQFNTNIGFFYEDVELDTVNTAEMDPLLPHESFYQKSGIALGGIYNTADPQLDPIQGLSLAMNIKTNGMYVTREMPFYKLILELKKYQAVRQGFILAFKLKGGSIKSIDSEQRVPVDERFFAGGSHSVRGWSRSDLGPKDGSGIPIGGNSLLESSIESRLAVGQWGTFVLFADAGNVWRPSFSMHLDDLHYAGGVGIRIKTPIGPAGLDFARPVFENNKTWQVHFNIGHPF